MFSSSDGDERFHEVRVAAVSGTGHVWPVKVAVYVFIIHLTSTLLVAVFIANFLPHSRLSPPSGTVPLVYLQK